MNIENTVEDLYLHLAEIADSFDVNFIPLNTLRMVIDERKIKSADGSIVKFAMNYNKLLEMLYQSCERQAKINGLTKIHLRHIRKYVDVIKSNL